MGIQIRSGFTAAAVQVGQARAEYRVQMVTEVEQVRAEAERLAREGTLAGVYNTLPGRYQRTDLLLESIYARPVLEGSAVGVEVGNTAPYASFVEYGTYGGYISPEEARTLAESLQGTALLYLGRSGLTWQAPNPAVTRAAAVAVSLLAKASSQALKQSFQGR